MDTIELNRFLFQEIMNENPRPRVMEDLIAKGADINALQNGESLLSSLIFLNPDCQKTDEVIYFLINKGINLNVDITDGFNCLFNACLTKNLKVLKILLNAGANPNCIDVNTGETLLDWAESEEFFLTTIEIEENYVEEHREIVSTLKRFGAKNSKDLK